VGDTPGKRCAVGISLRKNEKSGVVTLSGAIGLDQLPVMNDYIDLLLTNSVTTIYFDFSDVQTVSVSAIGALSAIRDRVDSHGGRLLLAGLRGDLNRLVGMDHLRRFFTVFDGPLPRDADVETGADCSEEIPGLEAVLPDGPGTESGPPGRGDHDLSGCAPLETD
jgi:anti-anti-sigma factor